ncbi:MAG: hypothetical protein BWY83_02267 [bacterium ADurb.Bin478]|nr:MAG: hypothetical protein BWY83_02267 [bacterium ADurb.Bin478]
MRFDKGDVAAPADAAVADIGAAHVREHLAVIVDIVAAREVDLLLRHAQLRPDAAKEVVPHPVLEAAGPVPRRADAVLVGIFVHVEGVQVMTRDVQLVDHFGDTGVGRVRGRQDHHELLPALVVRLLDAPDDVQEEGEAERGVVLDDADFDIFPRVPADVGLADGPGLLTNCQVAQRQVIRHGPILELLGHFPVLLLKFEETMADANAGQPVSQSVNLY